MEAKTFHLATEWKEEELEKVKAHNKCSMDRIDMYMPTERNSS
jgi:hypothetical protein